MTINYWRENMEESDHWISYDDDYGVKYWPTEELARKDAERSIESSKDDDGGWDDSVENIFYAKIVGRSVRVNEIHRTGNVAEDGVDEAGFYWASDEVDFMCDYEIQPDAVHSQVAELRAALRDMLSGWKYIRETHGDLYGVGWDRAQQKAEQALTATAQEGNNES